MVDASLKITQRSGNRPPARAVRGRVFGQAEVFARGGDPFGDLRDRRSRTGACSA